ncbi:MAG TPA: carbohydrate kinase [Thermoleophilaceae bacterium]
MIAVAGESLIDLMPGAGGTLVPRPGGGPFNVARGLARLEVTCAFLGAVSSDRFGTVLREALVRDGVDVSQVVQSGRPTTLAVAELDGAGSARYRFYTEGTAAASLTSDAALAALSAVAPRALHVGTLGLALEPVGDAIECMVEAVSDDVLVAVDPNWRPDVLDDPSPWRRRIDRVLTRADLIKVSSDDLAYLTPGVTMAESARALLLGRTRCVVVTNGPSDVLLFTPEGESRVTPPRARVVDTVGAGDAFCAGLLAWCAGHGFDRELLGALPSMEEAARLGATVAARSTERAGADPPRLVEVTSGEDRSSV